MLRIMTSMPENEVRTHTLEKHSFFIYVKDYYDRVILPNIILYY